MLIIPADPHMSETHMGLASILACIHEYAVRLVCDDGPAILVLDTSYAGRIKGFGADVKAASLS